MTGIQLLVIIVILIISINGYVIGWFNKITMYNGVELHYYSGWFGMLFICFCFFLIPFYKPIREYRKTVYIKNCIRTYEFWANGTSEHGGIPKRLGNSEYDRYMNFKRYLKLKELQKKTKKHRLW